MAHFRIPDYAQKRRLLPQAAFFFIFFTFSFRPVLLPLPPRITRAARCPWRLAIAVRGLVSHALARPRYPAHP